MSSIRLLLVPVYTESQEKHAAFINKSIRKRQEKLEAAFAQHGGQPTSQRLRQVEYEVQQEEGPWRTNRIVGYFDVRMDDGQIEVDVYKHDSKSFSRRPAMRFVDRGHRVDSIGTGDPVEIDEQSWLINVLREQHAIWFDRRFVDWTALEVLLRHTDLRSLMVSTLRKV